MELQTRGARKYPTSTLPRSSAGLGWSTLSAELRSHGVSNLPVIFPQHVELSLVVAGNDNCLVRRTNARRSQEGIPTTGAMILSPIGAPYNEITITAPIPKVLHLYLPRMLFRRLGDDFNLPESPAHYIRYVVGLRDEVINRIGLSILPETINESAAGRMYVETASLASGGRIIHQYRDSGSFTHTALGSPKLDHVRLRRVLDYISDHIVDEITVEDLARVACLSTFHFARMFRLDIGILPHRYVSRLRLANAMAEIAASRLPLAQITGPDNGDE